MCKMLTFIFKIKKMNSVKMMNYLINGGGKIGQLSEKNL